MMLSIKNHILILFISGLACFSYGQTEQQISFQKTFSKLFGYVRYFHPSDEASSIDWDRLAVYGCRMVDKCKSQQELKAVLNDLFLPIAPSLKIFKTKENIQFNAADITPVDKSKFKVIAWQHLGICVDRNKPSGIYRSERTNRLPINYWDSGLLFNKYPSIGECIDKEIGSGLSSIIPLALYGDAGHTYPVADPVRLAALKDSINSIPDSSLTGNNLYTRLAGVMISWNVFQHFYPYFDIVKTNWADDLSVALTSAYQDRSAADFLLTLQKLTAKLKDGHVEVRCSSIKQGLYTLPFNCHWVENQLVITEIFSDTLKIHRGNIITQINGIATKEYFKPIEERISAATKGWMETRAIMDVLLGQEDSEVNLTMLNADDRVIRMNIKRTMYWYKKLERAEKIRKIRDDIYYVNIPAVTDSVINSLMPNLVKCKSIIFDLRGYPRIKTSLISHLLTQKDTSKMWMRVPQIIYPDQEKIIGYKMQGWELTPELPHLDAKIIFIIDGSAISYAESFMSFIENYKLALLVGQPTAGTNGDNNPFKMPGGYTISWTGRKVVKHDGSQHHGIGIQPNILINRTIKGVREGRDEFLDKAIELARK